MAMQKIRNSKAQLFKALHYATNNRDKFGGNTAGEVAQAISQALGFVVTRHTAKEICQELGVELRLREKSVPRRRYGDPKHGKNVSRTVATRLAALARYVADLYKTFDVEVPPGLQDLGIPPDSVRQPVAEPEVTPAPATGPVVPPANPTQPSAPATTGHGGRGNGYAGLRP